MRMRLVVLGDSIAWGQYDPEGSGWAERLKVHFMDPLADFQIYNKGISGEITTDLLKHARAELEAIKPEIIIFAVGVNDVIYTPSKKRHWVELKQSKKNFSKLLKIARKYTNKIIFVGFTYVDASKVTPIPWNDEHYVYEKDVKAYNDMLESFCKQNKVSFIPLYNVINKEDLITPDGWHPNSKGHKKIFEIVKNHLEKEKFV